MMGPFRICHFGPETPALSQTFVYREALALKVKGHAVFVATVRRPETPANDVGRDLGEIFVVYDASTAQHVGALLSVAARRPGDAIASFGMLLSDLVGSAVEGRFAPTLFWHWLSSFTLSHYLLENEVDHLHTHFAHFPAQIAMYASCATGVPFSVMAHANDIFENALLLPRKAKRSRGFAMISEYNIKQLAEAGVPTEKMTIVRCGVSSENSPMLARTSSRKPGAFRVGSLGRLVEKKGMATLIDAIGQLKSEGNNVTLEIIGDGPLRQELESRMREQGLEAQVTFLGARANSEVLGWLSSLDLFALACVEDSNGDKDGIPVALMEAMAAGVPVASTRLSGVPELVIDGVSGLLSEPGDALGMARNIAALIKDPKLQARLAQGGVNHVSTEFGETVNIERLEHLIAGDAENLER